MWTVTYLAGKESELVQEIETYQQGIVNLPPIHSADAGTDQGWILSCFEVPLSDSPEPPRHLIGHQLTPKTSNTILTLLPCGE